MSALPTRRCPSSLSNTRQTMDVSLEDGIPKGFRPMDVGPQTTAALRVSRSLKCCVCLEPGDRLPLPFTPLLSAYGSRGTLVVVWTVTLVLCGYQASIPRGLPFLSIARQSLLEVGISYARVLVSTPAPPSSARNGHIAINPNNHRMPLVVLERCSGTGCSVSRSARLSSSGREMSWRPPCRRTIATICGRPGPRLSSSCAGGEGRRMPGGRGDSWCRLVFVARRVWRLHTL